MRSEKTQSFEDLQVWGVAHSLVLQIYRATKRFPSEEKFVLVPQLRRAAISITSNIAEGYGRKSPNDKEHFYVISYGSLIEVLNQLILARDLGYLSATDFSNLAEKSELVRRLLNGLLAAHRENRT